jgi:hypothetical protein
MVNVQFGAMAVDERVPPPATVTILALAEPYECYA